VHGSSCGQSDRSDQFPMFRAKVKQNTRLRIVVVEVSFAANSPPSTICLLCSWLIVLSTERSIALAYGSVIVTERSDIARDRNMS
jgi:hypothetical protein